MEIASSIKKRLTKKRIIFSIISAVLLTCLCYFTNNLPLFTGENLNQFMLTQKVCEKLGIHQDVDYGDAVYINISYDKELIPVYSYDEPKGVVATTDRHKLYKFLSMLQRHNQAKYIILDLAFDPEQVSEYDDSLYAKINEFENIVFARYYDFKNNKVIIPRPWLLSKSSLASYESTITATNLTRFQYTSNGERSIPARIFEYRHPEKKIRQYGKGFFSIYFSGHSLCQNSSFLTFDKDSLQEEGGEAIAIEGNDAYMPDSGQLSDFYNLGADIILPLEDKRLHHTEQEMLGKTKDRYVVIGDFIDDMHDTYMGPKQGSLILMRALQTLENGDNIVTLEHILLWLIIFFVMSILISNRESVLSYIPFFRHTRFKILHFLVDVLSFSVFFLVCEIIEYIGSGVVHSLIVPIIYFSLLKFYYHYKYFTSNEK